MDRWSQTSPPTTPSNPKTLSRLPRPFRNYRIRVLPDAGGVNREPPTDTDSPLVRRAEGSEVVPSRDRENLRRLSRALTRMNARIRTAGAPVAAPDDVPFLSQMSHIPNLVTDHGILDLSSSPAGPLADHRQWDEHVSSEEIADGLVIRVASLDDIIESKRAAGREKDRRALPYLESLRDVRDSS